jgi:CCR4-NOT transcription complex subunit 7/8
VFFTPDGKQVEIRDVWAETLETEMECIRKLLVAKPKPYNYIAMDTEFPGVVARPIGSFSTSTDYQYQTLRCNVDLLKIIQLGLSFFDADGNFAEGCPTWQFNYKFNLSEDMYAQDSIDMLIRSGIDFTKHEEHGIDVTHFGELLMTSGLVLVPEVKWISFHSGYDFGYLLKLLTCSPLPSEESVFFDLLHTYFPYIYDIKYLMLSCDNLKGGLQKVAEDLDVERIGPMHQAGSDSLLTAATFFKLVEVYFNGNLDDSKYAGLLYGLGRAVDPSASENS